MGPGQDLQVFGPLLQVGEDLPVHSGNRGERRGGRASGPHRVEGEGRGWNILAGESNSLAKWYSSCAKYGGSLMRSLLLVSVFSCPAPSRFQAGSPSPAARIRAENPNAVSSRPLFARPSRPLVAACGRASLFVPG